MTLTCIGDPVVEDAFDKYGCVLVPNHTYKFSCDVERNESSLDSVHITLFTKQYESVKGFWCNKNNEKYEHIFNVGENDIYCCLNFLNNKANDTITYSNIKIEQVETGPEDINSMLDNINGEVI